MKNGFFTRTLTITNAVYATGNWTLTTSTPHLLAVGDTFSIYDNSADGQTTVQATCAAGTTGSTIVFAYAQPLATFPSKLVLNKFPTGFTGTSDIVSMTSTGDMNFQATTTLSSGTGAHGATIQGSNDGIGWVTIGTFSATAAASPVSDNVSTTVPWVFARVNVTSLTGTGGQTLFSYVSERV